MYILQAIIFSRKKHSFTKSVKEIMKWPLHLVHPLYVRNPYDS
jgi:hypothetical protein